MNRIIRFFDNLIFKIQASGKDCTCIVDEFLGDVLVENYTCPYHCWLYKNKWKQDYP